MRSDYSLIGRYKTLQGIRDKFIKFEKFTKTEEYFKVVDLRGVKGVVINENSTSFLVLMGEETYTITKDLIQ